MASLFDLEGLNSQNELRILDPGAGIGSLSAALTERLVKVGFPGEKIFIDAYEIDEIMRLGLNDTKNELRRRSATTLNVLANDFIEDSVDKLYPSLSPEILEFKAYDLSILNPPYKKISSSSYHRQLLSKLGIETSNLYSAFFALTILLLRPGGCVCAIIPRSFCNGTYFRSFRQFLYSSSCIERLHVFDSRKDAFSQNEVLQENIIVYARKKSLSDSPFITVSRSHNDTLSDLSEHHLAATDIWGSAPERFIYIPATQNDLKVISRQKALPCTIDDLDISVSTGPVVQFRLRSSFSFSAGVPMLYCGSMRNGIAKQNTIDKKLAGYIEVNESSKKWLVSTGVYLLIRRFSSKEEKRRIVCAVYHPQAGQGDLIGIDNKLNFIHRNTKGLPLVLAYGLYVFLSSTLLDDFYRLVSGHTQVNSGDLRAFRYPSIDQLEQVGAEFLSESTDKQEVIDAYAIRYFK